MFSRASSRRSEAEGYAILIFKVQTTHRPRFRPKCKRPVSTFAQNILPQSLFHRFTAILSELFMQSHHR